MMFRCSQRAYQRVECNGKRMVNDNKRGKEDNVNRTRMTGIADARARDPRVAFATAPGKRHEC